MQVVSLTVVLTGSLSNVNFSIFFPLKNSSWITNYFGQFLKTNTHRNNPVHQIDGKWKTYTGGVCVCLHACTQGTFLFKTQYYCAALILVLFPLMQIKRNSNWLGSFALTKKRHKLRQNHSHGSQEACIKYNRPEIILHQFYQYDFISTSEIAPHLQHEN